MALILFSGRVISFYLALVTATPRQTTPGRPHPHRCITLLPPRCNCLHKLWWRRTRRRHLSIVGLLIPPIPPSAILDPSASTSPNTHPYPYLLSFYTVFPQSFLQPLQECFQPPTRTHIRTHTPHTLTLSLFSVSFSLFSVPSPPPNFSSPFFPSVSLSFTTWNGTLRKSSKGVKGSASSVLILRIYKIAT